jgi:hypothetical protein
MSVMITQEAVAKSAPATPEVPVVAVARNPVSRRRLKRGLMATGSVAGVWLALSFVVLPAGWSWRYRHVNLDETPRITWAGNKHAGDPLNVALVGTKDEIVYLFLSAGWHAADPITYASAKRMAKATLFKHPYPNAPFSNLFLREGKSRRKQDLGFQRCVDNNPRKRHHVRFWQTDQVDAEGGRPFWIGAASYDRRAKFNWFSLAPTHAIDGDVDAERDDLFGHLRKTGQLLEEELRHFHTVLEGRNGGGDRWFTDGKLAIGIIAPDNVPVEE